MSDTTAPTRTVAVVSAGLSQPSSTRMLADQLAAATRDALTERGVRVELPVVEVRDHAHAVVDHTLTGFPPAGLEPVMTTLTSADGLIAATPTFNASYSGLFKTLFDLLPEDALTGVPVLIAATGGTPRHSLVLDHALRPLFSYLRAVVVPTGVFAGPDDWAGGAAEGLLRERINRAATELADEVARRPPRRPTDPFALPASFEELLGRGGQS
ncbi:MAG TPA: FMN reductase [Natronosporangium sp.]|nr:FMN reductase [Natronosporangium sp.]